MPISDIQFENGIFFAREYGVLDDDDAQTWTEALRYFAESNPQPIVALVDAREVKSITRSAGRIFAESSQTPNLMLACVAAGSAMMAQVSRNISMHGKRGSSYIFMDFDEARQFAEEQASIIQN